MALERALLVADVSHARLRPEKNAFRYRVYYLAIALSALERLRGLTLFSLDRFNLFGLRRRDYGNGEAPPEVWARGVLAQWNMAEVADGEIVLITMPRLLEYTFNPVSFWFCCDQAGAVRAVISEVTNTFRDKHSYLSFRDDRTPITGEDWLRAEKIFHVSPFLKIEGYYQFRFVFDEKKIGVWINYYDAEGLILTTAVTGQRRALTSAALVYCMLRYPFVVMGLIHYQALKLFSKGVRYHRRPVPPTVEVSR